MLQALCSTGVQLQAEEPANQMPVMYMVDLAMV